MDYSSDEEVMVKSSHSCLTVKEAVISGLELNRSKGLDVVKTADMGLGVVAKEFIHKNEYVTEYKYCKLYAEKERAEYEDEYDLNDEGCYIMDVKIKGRWHCLDATRRFKSYGRYINHALPGKANVKPHPVLFVNGKYRVGFYALRDICPGEELFWDYSYQKNAPNWLRRKKIERDTTNDAPDTTTAQGATTTLDYVTAPMDFTPKKTSRSWFKSLKIPLPKMLFASKRKECTTKPKSLQELEKLERPWRASDVWSASDEELSNIEVKAAKANVSNKQSSIEKVVEAERYDDTSEAGPSHGHEKGYVGHESGYVSPVVIVLNKKQSGYLPLPQDPNDEEITISEQTSIDPVGKAEKATPERGYDKDDQISPEIVLNEKQSGPFPVESTWNDEFQDEFIGDISSEEEENDSDKEVFDTASIQGNENESEEESCQGDGKELKADDTDEIIVDKVHTASSFKKVKFKRCPIPNCQSKPQKRIGDHIRLCHPNITPRKRKRLCKFAPTVSKLRPPNQKKLKFSTPSQTPLFNPVFENSPESSNSQRLQNTGKKGTTRGMGLFPIEIPELVDFRKYLSSVEGGYKSAAVSKEIVCDISKIMYYGGSKKFDWLHLINHNTILSFFEKIKEMGIGPEGRLTKMERVTDALKYLKFNLHSHKGNEEKSVTLTKINAMEESLGQWKAVLRRDKKRLAAIRLEKASNELPPLESINDVVDSPKLLELFNKIVRKRQDGAKVEDEELRFAVAAVCIPLMLTCSSRPGAIINCTQKEYEMGRMVDGLYLVSVHEHKTGMLGTAVLSFSMELHAQAEKYRQWIRPALIAESGDLPNFFVMPNSQKIQKINNLSRIVSKKLGLSVPSATDVRKMGSTAVARNCSKDEALLLAKQMNHDPKVASDYYEAVRSDHDRTRIYHTLSDLRSKSTTNQSARKLWNADQSSSVYDYFETKIISGITPTLTECAALECRLEGKNAKQIQDKVRTYIRGRKKESLE